MVEVDYLFVAQEGIGEVVHVLKVGGLHLAGDGNGVVAEDNVLHLAQGQFHRLSRHGCPRAVLHESYAARLVVLQSETVEEVRHGGEHRAVVRRAAERQAAEAEGL